jgi:hypothetical protein
MITIDKFNELTSELIGLPLTQVSDSYGDVVVLDFGNLTNLTHPKLSHLKQAEYTLVIKMSNLVINGDLINHILKEVVVSFTLNLHLTFDNNKSIDVFSLDTETELPYWELSLPGDNYIVADTKGLQLLDKHSYV